MIGCYHSDIPVLLSCASIRLHPSHLYLSKLVFTGYPIVMNHRIARGPGHVAGQFDGRFANPLQKNSGWPNEEMINEVNNIGAVTRPAGVDQRCNQSTIKGCMSHDPKQHSTFVLFPS